MPKAEEVAPTTEEIQVRLLNEGTDVWRPTKGRRVSGMTFKLEATPDYDPESEEWEFLPGTTVTCRHRELSGGVFLVAVGPAPAPDSGAKDTGRPA